MIRIKHVPSSCIPHALHAPVTIAIKDSIATERGQVTLTARVPPDSRRRSSLMGQVRETGHEGWGDGAWKPWTFKEQPIGANAPWTSAAEGNLTRMPMVRIALFVGQNSNLSFMFAAGPIENPSYLIARADHDARR